MNARQVLLLLGGILLIAGIIALLTPVSASGGNESVGCGNAVASDFSQAQAKDQNLGNAASDIVSSVAPSIGSQIPQTHYVDACNSALSTRRAWSIPLAAVGLLVVAGSFMVRGRAGVR